MIELDTKYKPVLLEALEELMYKISLELNELKGQPLTASRKALTKKQNLLEELQHLVSISE